MASGPGEAVSRSIHIELDKDGYLMRVDREARTLSLPEVLSYVISLGLPSVDYNMVALAHQRADGVPLRISTRPAPDTSTRRIGTDPPPSPPDTSTRVVGAGVPQTPAAPPKAGATTTRRLASGAHPITAASVSTSTATIGPHCVLVCVNASRGSELKSAFEKVGIDVALPSTLREAVAEVVRRPPDLLVVEHPLGEEDALALCRLIRSRQGSAKTPVLVIAGTPTRALVLEGIRAGASDFVVPPLNQGTILLKVSKALEAAGKPVSVETREALDSETAAAVRDETEVKSLGKIDLGKLIKKVQRLTALPNVVERVLSITANDKSGSKDLAVAVESDPAIAAAIMKRANSVAYASAQRTFNVQESTVRLGFSLTRSLVVGMSVFRAFSKDQKTVGFNRMDFWRHSLAAGIVARQLACRMTGVATDSAFLGGLLHDLGKIILDEYCPADFERACLTALKDLVPMSEAEMSVLGTTHTQVGAAVLDAWKFPPAIIAAIGAHHSPYSRPHVAESEGAKLCRTVAAANQLAKALGEGNGGDSLLAELEEGAWEGIGVPLGLPESFAKDFDAELQRSRDFLGLDRLDEAPAAKEREVVFFDDRRPPGSVLGLAIERAGFKRRVLIEARGAASLAPGSAHAGVVRASTPEGLSLIAEMLRTSAALASAPIVGVLPKGQKAPEGLADVTVLFEPYDRMALLSALQA